MFQGCEQVPTDLKRGGSSSGGAELGLREQWTRESRCWAVLGWCDGAAHTAGGLIARSYLAGANTALPSTHVEVVDVPLQPLAAVAELFIHHLDLGLLQDISS